MSKVKNSRPLRDWILLVMGENLPNMMDLIPITEAVLAKGYKTTSKKPVELVRKQLHRLDDSWGMVFQGSLHTFLLTTTGIGRTKFLWHQELSTMFDDKWITPLITSAARERTAPILNDLLIDAGASEQVTSYCNHPVLSNWLMEWIEIRKLMW